MPIIFIACAYNRIDTLPDMATIVSHARPFSVIAVHDRPRPFIRRSKKYSMKGPACRMILAIGQDGYPVIGPMKKSNVLSVSLGHLLGK